MPGSVTAAFSELEDFAAAMRSESCLDLLITEHGQFRARLTQITLYRLRLSAGEEQLSRIAFIRVPADVVLILFPIGNGTLPIYSGIGMQVGEIMTFGPDQQVHARTKGHHRWGALWVPVEELSAHSRALTGAPFGVPDVAQIWRPRPAAGGHRRGTRQAGLNRLDAEAAHGLEQQLIDAVVECLAGCAAGDRPGGCYQDTMAHFERLLQTQPDRVMRMTEICAALGVSHRLLRNLCAEYLGMSPIGYDRLRRMSLVRHALRGGYHNAASVSEVARRFGFRDLVRFAADYHARFGEFPSATLRRGADGRTVDLGSPRMRDRE